jgi:hypothetical protein
VNLDIELRSLVGKEITEIIRVQRRLRTLIQSGFVESTRVGGFLATETRNQLTVTFGTILLPIREHSRPIFTDSL